MTGREKGWAALALTALLAGCSMAAPADGVRPVLSLGGGSIDMADPVARGKALLAMGQYGLAIEALQGALAQEPDAAKTLNALAVAYDKIGRHDLADRYFGEALALDPRSVAVLNNWGYSRLLRGDLASARDLLEEAAAQDAGSAVVAGNLTLAEGFAIDTGTDAAEAVSPTGAALVAKPVDPPPPMAGHVTVMRKVPAVERLAWGVQLLVTKPTAPAEIPAAALSDARPGPEIAEMPLQALSTGPVRAEDAGRSGIAFAAVSGEAPAVLLAVQPYAHAAPPSANCVLARPALEDSCALGGTARDDLLITTAELTAAPFALQIADLAPFPIFRREFR